LEKVVTSWDYPEGLIYETCKSMVLKCKNKGRTRSMNAAAGQYGGVCVCRLVPHRAASLHGRCGWHIVLNPSSPQATIGSTPSGRRESGLSTREVRGVRSGITGDYRVCVPPRIPTLKLRNARQLGPQTSRKRVPKHW
jgi:hypothetical protein